MSRFFTGPLATVAAAGLASLLFVAVAEAGPFAPAPTAAAKFGWGSPTYQDDFDTGGRPNVENWNVYNGAGHQGEGRRSPWAWRVHDGVATVTGDGAGTTGGMAARWAGSSSRFSRWEVRMKTSPNRDPKYHPVLILWPTNNDWRCGGEIDFSEGITTDLRNVHFFHHYSCQDQTATASLAIDTSVWHVYAVQVTPDGVAGYIDGQLWFQDYDRSHLPPGPLHLTMQLDWFPERGRPTKQTTMDIDWVRQYSARALQP